MAGWSWTQRSSLGQAQSSVLSRPRKFDVLFTSRLQLRRWRGSDRGPFARMNADPEVMRFFPARRTRAESDALIDRIERGFDERGFGLWAVERLDTGEFIGFTGLNPMPAGTPGEGDFEVGWRLSRRAWGHGFATEAARASIQVGLAAVGLPRLWSLTAVTNLPSQSVMRRAGLREHSRYDHPGLADDDPLRRHVAYWAEGCLTPAPLWR